MFKRTILCLVAIASFLSFSHGSVVCGEPSPLFSVYDARGTSVRLDHFRGNYVVLEWLDYGCPFVRKHYHSGNMQRMQSEMKGQEVVWLSFVSCAKGPQGNGDLQAVDALKKSRNIGSNANHLILDSDGAIARSYGVKCTPQVFLIDPGGLLIYQGAVDSNSSLNELEVRKAKNYLLNAWNQHRKGKAVVPDTTAPYGCAVRY